jgi:zinc D-Ala-D-Ala carboxypeptidase
MNLTKNFTLEEMTKSETALRYDIDNTPNEQEISAMKLLAEKVLQPVRDHFGKGVKCQ